MEGSYRSECRDVFNDLLPLGVFKRLETPRIAKEMKFLCIYSLKELKVIHMKKNILLSVLCIFILTGCGNEVSSDTISNISSTITSVESTISDETESVQDIEKSTYNYYGIFDFSYPSSWLVEEDASEETATFAMDDDYQRIIFLQGFYIAEDELNLSLSELADMSRDAFAANDDFEFNDAEIVKYGGLEWSVADGVSSLFVEGVDYKFVYATARGNYDGSFLMNIIMIVPNEDAEKYDSLFEMFMSSCVYYGETDNIEAESKNKSEEDGSASEKVETHIYDDAQYVPVYNGDSTDIISSSSVIEIDSSEVTEEALNDWYYNLVKKGFCSYYVIVYKDDPNHGVYSSGGYVDVNVLLEKDEKGVYSVSDTDETITYWDKNGRLEQ